MCYYIEKDTGKKYKVNYIDFNGDRARIVDKDGNYIDITYNSYLEVSDGDTKYPLQRAVWEFEESLKEVNRSAFTNLDILIEHGEKLQNLINIMKNDK